jgi:hypothetical protein
MIKPLIILHAPCPGVEAAFVMNKIQNNTVAYIEDLEVLDKVLNMVPDDTEFQSGTKILSLELVKRLRFERGLDVRPRQ